jgi:hypothetical protein
MSASGKFAKLPHFLQFVPTHFRTPSERVVEFSERFPRVARSSQPWAECRYPVGVNQCPAIVANKSRTFAARHGVPPMGYRAVEGISAGQTGKGHQNRFGTG